MKIKFALISVLAFLVICIMIPFGIFFTGKQKIYVSTDVVNPVSVAIVFGAGLADQQTPSDALRDRLVIAAELYRLGKVQHILVSGDNQYIEHNEPDVMHDALVEEFAVPDEVIAVDYAGRRTYDTCIRARDIWGIEEAVLISQGYHLPRAIWTCERLGIESTGVSASLQSYIYGSQYELREIAAMYKAIIDLYMKKPFYIGGEMIEDLDP
ncbi:MAG: hypothetical protein UU08_C0003G0009 [Candidatus Uhrbacteria bacterium GW2011_GWE2_40_58]|nr:MAG: hypothetical protein UT94_C0004G0009 [Candidatus Uhrbacteria bacterium GW2011_GWF2_40_263]KKR68086.1 MAG: hypothetical protein UU08_C0003G0009 [Candidatus Uhrbacteria bacterium GW2011_GWE2_40_58]OGL91787.1 MAG: hypothetical protein A2239_04480 [Candidatus Uhrbacteria bacterium RIFOXYA2_FULL_40_9]OGL97237.1 MAG: hypothetical protein A2332_01455 [Candidatus Uhrbacteria bacterium RIFOXYB2_FULL_41_18]HBK34456.1 hypothetical protein [Candidatus Uhrbacteria bacterium]